MCVWFLWKKEFFFFDHSGLYTAPHEGLNGKTPAEACGIKVEGQDKWKTDRKCK
jgi:hypothetical protein